MWVYIGIFIHIFHGCIYLPTNESKNKNIAGVGRRNGDFGTNALPEWELPGLRHGPTSL